MSASTPPAPPAPPALREQARDETPRENPRVRSMLVLFGLIVLGAAAFWVLVQAVQVLRPVLVPTAIGVLLTGLLMPLQVLLNHRLRLPRLAAALATLLIAVGSLATLMYLAGAQLAQGVAEVRKTAAFEMSQIKDWLVDSPLPIGRSDINAALDRATEWLSDNGSSIAQGALGAGYSAGSAIFGAFLCLFVVLFLLAQGDRIAAWLIALLPHRHRAPAYEAGRRGWVTLGTYTKMQVVIAGADAVGIGLGAWALGVPFVLPLTAITFVLCVIPVVGALVSGALVVLVALAFQGPMTALIMLAIVIGVQQLESDVLAPLLMGKAVNVHPLAVLLAVAGGSYIAGILGALFAVPLVATVNTMGKYLTGRDPFPLLDAGCSALTDPPRRLVGSVGTPEVPKRIGSATPSWLEHERAGARARAAADVRGARRVEADQQNTDQQNAAENSAIGGGR